MRDEFRQRARMFVDALAHGGALFLVSDAMQIQAMLPGGFAGLVHQESGQRAIQRTTQHIQQIERGRIELRDVGFQILRGGRQDGVDGGMILISSRCCNVVPSPLLLRSKATCQARGTSSTRPSSLARRAVRYNPPNWSK
jgi:hypothetical protein